MGEGSAVSLRTLLLVGAGWLLIAIAVGAAGVVRALRPSAARAGVVELAVALLGGAGWLVAEERDVRVLAIDITATSIRGSEKVDKSGR